MRSTPEDRTTRAVLRDESLRLFAEKGPENVSVREIAAAAGASPGLVLHHFGSKDGLREEVDQYVLDAFDRMLGAITADGARDPSDPAAAGRSLAEVMLQHLPSDSPIPAYLSRLLLSGSTSGRQLFVRLHELSRATLDAMVEAGLAAPGRDPAVRAAVLMANDLAVLLLREHLTAVLDTDPLSAEGLARWGPEVLAIYSGGLTAAPAAPAAPGTDGADGAPHPPR
ncbi:TetR/AcrR family transcriptional regulator [Streptomyces sp. NPDC048172]|uniref:TetR/AcrR family transcriptional regulator n=1 Tax=Streptomyces sp. NPDC048172 TaxID=3365505 RepID=UPI00371FB127